MRGWRAEDESGDAYGHGTSPDLDERGKSQSRSKETKRPLTEHTSCSGQVQQGHARDGGE